MVQQKRSGQRVSKNRLLSHCCSLSPWEAERILQRREQSRKRKAFQRAQETEEQRNSRREKERLAKAALRATEPAEKRMVRREKDRIAKAISRAAESEEQRRIRREKNRIAMAALRAAQTEEERYIRREKDRIKKAAIRAFETEEQKKLRREKNRIAMAIRRANLNEQERNCLRSVTRIAKTGSRYSRMFESENMNLKAIEIKGVERDSQKLPYYKESYWEDRNFELSEFGVNAESVKGRGGNDEEIITGNGGIGCLQVERKTLSGCTSTSNQNFSGLP